MFYCSWRLICITATSCVQKRRPTFCTHKNYIQNIIVYVFRSLLVLQEYILMFVALDWYYGNSCVSKRRPAFCTHTKLYTNVYNCQHMRFWYLSFSRPINVIVSLRNSHLIKLPVELGFKTCCENVYERRDGKDHEPVHFSISKVQVRIMIYQ